jgi:hypothetical protein
MLMQHMFGYFGYYQYICITTSRASKVAYLDGLFEALKGAVHGVLTPKSWTE